MTRVKCKDEGHEGDTSWVYREDCLLVPRYAGGNYRRAGRMYPTVICLACASRYVAKIEAGEYQGALKVNRWSKSGLTYQYAQFRRRVGLPERTPMSNEPKTTPVVEQDDSEATIAVPWDDLPEEERQAWIDAAKPGVFPTKHAQGKADYERANREKPKGTEILATDEELAEHRARQAREASGRVAHLAYGGLVPRKPGEFHHHFTAKLPASKCTICGGSIYETCRGPKADEWEARMQARRELKERIFYLAYGRSDEGHAEAADAMAEFNAETLRLFPDRFRKPTPEEQEARERFVELVAYPLTPTFQQTAAEALRAIRARQGRTLHEARPFHIVPNPVATPLHGRMEVAEPDLQQVPFERKAEPDPTPLQQAAETFVQTWAEAAYDDLYSHAHDPAEVARIAYKAGARAGTPWPKSTELATPEGRLGILVRETFPWSISASTMATQTIRGLIADLEGQEPSIALDGYEAVNSAEEERMAQELMEIHGYKAVNSAEEVADRALNPCKERNHRRWHCHYAKGHKGEHAFTDADEMRHMKARIQELEDDAQTYHLLTERQSDLLRATVNALRGDPPELVWWSLHDVAELAQAAVQTIARTLARADHWQFDVLTEEAKAHFMEQARKAIVEEAGNG